MAKIDTLSLTKTAKNHTLHGCTTYKADIREYPRGRHQQWTTEPPTAISPIQVPVRGNKLKYYSL